MPAVDPSYSDGIFSSSLSYLIHSLKSTIPPPLFYILARFSNLIWRLVAGVSNDPTSWTSTLLPPLIALLAAYVSLLMAYRTLRSTILLIWWGIKWGAILGAGIAIWAWWTGNEDAVRSVGEAPNRGAGLFSWLGGGDNAGWIPPLLAFHLSPSATPSAAPLEGAKADEQPLPNVLPALISPIRTAALATALPLLSGLYGAAMQGQPNTRNVRGAMGRRSASRRSNNRRQSSERVFDPFDEESDRSEAAGQATFLQTAFDAAGSLFDSTNTGGRRYHQRRQRTTAERIGNLFDAGGIGATDSSSDHERHDVLHGLLNSIGLGGLVAQGVDEDGDQSQLSRWMEMLRESLAEQGRMRTTDATRSRSRTGGSRRRGSWFGSSREGEDDEGDVDEDLFVPSEDEEESASWSSPWSSTRGRRDGPAFNTRSSRRRTGTTGRSGRR